jgi:hypothetical protein
MPLGRTFEIRSDDALFETLTKYIASKYFPPHVIVSSTLSDERKLNPTKIATTEFSGTHRFTYLNGKDKQRVEVSREKEGDHGEVLYIQTEHEKTVNSLLKEAEAYEKNNIDRVNFQFASPKNWLTGGYLPKKSMDSICMKENTKSALIGAVDVFLKDKEHYISKGVPYNYVVSIRGDLGSGRKTLVRAMCTHFDKTMGYIPASLALDPTVLYETVMTSRHNTFAVIDDLDSLIAGKGVDEKEIIKEFLTESFPHISPCEGLVVFVLIRSDEMEKCIKHFADMNIQIPPMNKEFVKKLYTDVMKSSDHHMAHKDAFVTAVTEQCGKNDKIPAGVLQRYLMAKRNDKTPVVFNKSDLPLSKDSAYSRMHG